MGRRVILFDIDGTLIVGHGAGRRAMDAAARTLFGVERAFHGIPMHGRTDPLIARDGFRRHGLPEDALPAFFSRYVELLPEELSRTPPDAAPGIPELLAGLRNVPDVLLGLVTGNIRAGAELKLRAAAIDPGIFRVGAFGDDHADRPVLARLAMDRAALLAAIDRASAWLIGDTPADVDAGRAAGLRTLAVATGGAPEDRLRATEATRVLADLSAAADVARLLIQGD